MIVVEAEQGSQEWIEARLGVVTASKIDKVLTASLNLSTKRTAYMAELLAETLTGEPQDGFQSEWMEYGKAMEGEARKWYSFHTGLDVRQVGFVYMDNHKDIGCSPDALVYKGDERVGCNELKCPAPKTHMAYWIDAQNGLRRYMRQVQFQLWVTGLGFNDFVSYCPGLPNVAVRVEPSEAHFDAFDKHIPAFVDELQEARAKLAEQGYVAL